MQQVHIAVGHHRARRYIARLLQQGVNARPEGAVARQQADQVLTLQQVRQLQGLAGDRSLEQRLTVLVHNHMELAREQRRVEMAEVEPGHNIKFFFGDGFKGLPTYAPFDKILITAAAPFVPPMLIEQLKTGGMMVIPVNEGEVQRMMRITKLSDGSLQEELFDEFSFVPMLQGKTN